MNFLIDTCCLSELVKKKPDANVLNWFNDQDELTLYLSIITFGELRKGIEKLTVSKRKNTLERWVQEDLMNRFQNRVLDISIQEVNRWGEILAKAEETGRPIPAIDALIAATASVHELIIVTRNTKDMEETGVELVDPWNYDRS